MKDMETANVPNATLAPDSTDTAAPVGAATTPVGATSSVDTTPAAPDVFAAGSPAPAATMSLAYEGDGLYLITSRKRRADGGYDEAQYPVYAQSLRCGCPAGLRGTGRSGLCKHSRFLNDYLCGRAAEYVEYDR